MNLKNYNQLKIAALHGHCVYCFKRDLVILGEKTFTDYDALMCMVCGGVSNQYAMEYQINKSKQVPVVELTFTPEGMMLKDTTIYTVEKGGVYYQVETIGGNSNVEHGKNNNQGV